MDNQLVKKLFAFYNSASGDHCARRHQEGDIIIRYVWDCHKRTHLEPDLYKIAIEEDTKRKIYM